MKLLELAYERREALNRVSDLAENFVKHFDKIYNDTDNEAIIHWASEMQAWLDTVLRIKIKDTGKHLSLQQKMDWFFTCGSDSETLFENPTEAEVYDDFINLVTVNNDVKKSLKEIDLMY